MASHGIVLIICDGMGYREATSHNAIAQAKTPHLDYYRANYPFALLDASGEAVGLPEGQMGTSEANHLVIGSGRIVFQNLAKINRAVRNQQLGVNVAIKEAFDHVKEFNSVLHIKSIISDGGVHGHIDHLKALLSAAKNAGVKNIMLHLFTDGRDTAPKSALGYIDDLESFMAEQKIGRIASLGGRYWGMDRDNNDDRIEKHYLVMTAGIGQKFKSAREIILHNYEQDITDEYLEPALVEMESGELGCIQANDAVISANFRADRAKQLTKKFVQADIDNLKYVAMTKYEDGLDVRIAFPPEEITHTLSQELASHNIKQLKVTETEKFAHLTFFFNAQIDQAESGEDRILITSNKDVISHDTKPEMKAFEISQTVISAIKNNSHQFIATNLTNCDMVGHSGNVEAIVSAVEIVDTVVGQIVTAAQAHNFDVIITADHGNAEETFDQSTGQALTAHTLNPVPFYFISNNYHHINHTTGSLADIAPTVLTMFNLPVPPEMTGQSFI
ncbi:MAG: 2,3-bisphosphoglycerate-independent phosphoglycerate mutase [Candidatus Falkowbacteria bacterium]